MSIQASITGRLTGDPELRWTPGGKAVASLSIAVNHRRKNQAGEYEDSGTTFLRASLWEYQAEQAADQLRKGQLVTARGRIETRTWTDKDGQQRDSLELQVDDIGAVIAKYPPKGQSQPASSPGGFGGAPQSQSDPWGGQPSGGGWDTPSAAQSDSPPF